LLIALHTVSHGGGHNCWRWFSRLFRS